MSLATSASIVGALADSTTDPGNVHGSVRGWLVTLPPLPAVAGVLSDAVVRSYDDPVVAYGCRVVLDGNDVTSDLVESDVGILRELDRSDACEITLQGSQYSFLNSRKLWTRVSLQVFFSQKNPNTLPTEELIFDGFVWTGTQVSLNVFSCQAYVAGNTAFNNKVCFELDPGVDRTRGSILRELAIASGFDSADIPDGAVYSKPLQVDQSFRDIALSFGEPEGWHFRVSGGALESYVIRRGKPQPDHKWNANISIGIDGVNLVPPEEVASTWIFRGQFSVNIGGEEEETTETFSNTAKGFFNPQTLSKQDSNGVITPRDFALGAPYGSFLEFRIIKQLTTTIVRLGSRVIRQEEVEFAWINPRSAQYRTASSGPGPQNANFVDTFIDQFGNHVVNSSAQFVMVLKRIEFFTYDDNGTLISSRIQSFEYHTITKAVANDSQQEITGVLVGDDLQSYDRNGPKLFQISDFGLAAEYFVTHTYDDETGRRISEVQSSFAHYSVRTHSVVGFRLFNGTFQKDLVASFIEVETHFTDNLSDNSSLKVGEVRSTQEYFASDSVLGAFDYGDRNSDFEEEVFVTTKIEADSFNAFTENDFMKVEYANLRRRSQNFPGRPPTMLHRASVWTQYASAPMESLLQDDVVESLFGRGFEIVNLEHVQNQNELDFVLERRRARAFSFIIEFERHETVALIGDDVLITDVEQGHLVRGIIIAERIRRQRSISLAEYTIEITQVDGVSVF